MCKSTKGSHTHNFLTGDGELVNTSERAKKIVDGDMFSPEERDGLKMFLDIPGVNTKPRCKPVSKGATKSLHIYIT